MPLNDLTSDKNQANDDLDFSGIYIRILRYLNPFKSFLFIAFIGYAMFAASQPAFAFLMEGFVNALEGRMVDGLYLIPAACIAIALLRGVGSYLGSYYMAKLCAKVVHLIRCDLFSNITYLPIAYFDNNKSGRLVSLITYNINIMAATTAKAFTTVVREGLTVIALFAYLFYQNAQLTLVFLALGPPLMLTINWIGKKIKHFGRGIQTSVGELNHVASENFGGIRLVKSAAGERVANTRFEEVSKTATKIGLKLSRVSSIYTPMMQMMIVIAMAVVMYIVLLSRDTMDAAALIAYVTAAALLPKPIRSLSGVHPQMLQGVVAAEEVFRHIDHEKEMDTGVVEDVQLAGNITFKDVTFSYPQAEKDEASSSNPDVSVASSDASRILDNINFEVSSGETVALVGRSGGGKSTLVNLIPRFYDLTEGRIHLDGLSIDNYNLSFLRRNIAIVSQQVTLFNDSIANNIAYGVEGATLEDIEKAAIAANADEFIKRLPEQYDSLVGENGVLLSGGQRQRLAIARAILKRAPILILDEATSALDNESEAKVQTALENVMKNRTTLVIAHRLSTIEHADKIIVLDKGKIIEQGSHAELIANGGFYFRMVQRDFTD